MKLFTVITFILSSHTLIAQKAIDTTTVVDAVVTTEEEYNYITKGYNVQVIEQGGDLKRGYELLPIQNGLRISNFTFDVRLFKRTSSQEICATMVIVNSASSRRTYYLCIPTNNSQLLTKYYASLGELDYYFQAEYAKVMSVMYSELLTSINKPKKVNIKNPK